MFLGTRQHMDSEALIFGGRWAFFYWDVMTAVNDMGTMKHYCFEILQANLKTAAKVLPRIALFQAVLVISLLLAVAIGPALAEEKFCSDYPNGVIDGFVDPVPVQITIDRDCTFQNFPASNPLTSTLNFQTNDPSIYLIIFNNVIFTGHMACANVDHRIWFANGSDYGSSNSCQDLFIPVESIDKQSPGPTATIGEPFTYTLTLPSMTIVGGPSLNDLHTVTLWDDLTTTGADLSYVSHNAYYKSTGQSVTLTPENNPNSPGGQMTTKNISFQPIPLIPKGEQIVVEITVVADDSTTNVAGTSFVNTAKWSFGRLIEGQFYEPLPGEWGVSPPMSIVEPNLVVTKNSDETALNLGTAATFTVDVRNAGGSDAWNVTVLDQIPNGMCDRDPTAELGVIAQIVEPDGSLVANLNSGTDYSVTYDGTSGPSCPLTISTLTDRARIAPDQRLLITYQSQLDGDITTDGLQLTNIAGAIQWQSADPNESSPPRTYNRPITDGTPGIDDHQDSQIVTTALTGYYFQKTVTNLASNIFPATTASPGDRLRYRLRLFNVNQLIDDVTISDQLDATVFDLNSFAMVSLPTGTNHSFNTASGELQIFGSLGALNVPVGGELVIEFEITLLGTLANDSLVENQATLNALALTARSDDPYVNGIAPPSGDPPPDPTRLWIQTPSALFKTIKGDEKTTATIGERFAYQITVPETAVDVPLYDVRILDDLSSANAELRFVSASVISGGTWTLGNTGSETSLVIEDTTAGIDIPAGGQAVIELIVELENTTINQAGLSFNNTARYTYNRINGSPATQQLGAADVSKNLTVTEPDLTATKTLIRYITPSGKLPTAPAAAGDILEYQVTVTNIGSSTAFDTSIVDRLPANASLELDSATAVINGVPVDIFVANPTTLDDGELAWGQQNGDGSLDIPVGQSLVLTYQIALGAIISPVLSNTVFVDWTSLDGATTVERTGEGCPAVTVPNDYCFGPASVTLNAEVDVSLLKEVSTANAEPGDSLTYTLTLSNESSATLTNLDLIDELAVEFEAGSLSLVSISDPNADITNIDVAGGANATGLVDIRNINLAAQGEPSDSLVVVFSASLVTVLDNGTTVSNQALLLSGNLPIMSSNATTTEIRSAPILEIWKTSEDLTGDPAVLLPGDTLRYTIIATNTGNENLVNSVLTDQIPTNTSYVNNSATLNGNPVDDLVINGDTVSPLQNGLLINDSSSATAGMMSADPNGTIGIAATVTFDVTIDGDVVDGTIIANQGIVNAESAGNATVHEEPSDDPGTPVEDDPTLDVVGGVPFVDAHKTVELLNDPDGVVNGGDTLLYTIVLTNRGAAPATNVVFTDPIPEFTSYNSATLNGASAGDFDGTTLSIEVTGGDGALPPGGTAEITLTVDVNSGVADNTLISNQGIVSSNEQIDEPTDADGIDSNGDQPTEIYVGSDPFLAIVKSVSVVGGGNVKAGSQLEYVIQVSNISTSLATGVILTDDLSSLADNATYYDNPDNPGLARLNGSTAGINYIGTTLTAIIGNMEPGDSATLRFRVQVATDAAIGTTLTNTGTVIWDDNQSASSSVSVDIGGEPGIGSFNGLVWHDVNLDSTPDDTEPPLANWTVSLYRGTQLIGSTIADVDGSYGFSGLNPAGIYTLEFSAPWAGPNTGSLGNAVSPFNNGPQRISDIVVASGSNLQNLNLPITPNGVVYDSVLRTPVAGVQVNLLNENGSILSATCFDDPAQQNQATGPNGFYKFDLTFNALDCPSGATYLVAVTPPSNGYQQNGLGIIPPENDGSYDPNDPNSDPVNSFLTLDVPNCPGNGDDALPSTDNLCEVSAAGTVPPTSVGPGDPSTTHYLKLSLDDQQNQAFNNHLPIDPVLNGAITITKTSTLINVHKGQLVPYTITVRNQLNAPLYGLTIVDTFPAGFKYVSGSARLDGEPLDGQLEMAGRQLRWNGIDLPFEAELSVKLLLVVGAGVSEDKYVNQAHVEDISGAQVSAVATATVRVVPDPTFDCTDVIGKVFDDRNLNGQQDPGERGLAGVRLATARGLISSTDAHGRFHITCAAVPDQDRGSNFILKLDDRSLPTGFRTTTENPRVLRATRGKILKFNFGATIHRVVGLDVADGVFESDETDLRVQWHPRLRTLIDELQKEPSVLRLSYLADVEPDRLVRARLKSLQDEIDRLWNLSGGGYPLTVETEVFWRRGSAP
ncbi:MAG: DUF11 domain-containing protein [Deltaproteobacteria bacterium]|nr:DUF11 domain-containing protein [Deltaproteobacteria bacterium]